MKITLSSTLQKAFDSSRESQNNNLETESFYDALDAISEGPIEGLVNSDGQAVNYINTNTLSSLSNLTTNQIIENIQTTLIENGFNDNDSYLYTTSFLIYKFFCPSRILFYIFHLFRRKLKGQHSDLKKKNI